MPAYLIRHAKNQHGDVLIEDDNLVLKLTSAWAAFTKDGAIALAVPIDQIASIQQIDEPEDEQAKE